MKAVFAKGSLVKACALLCAAVTLLLLCLILWRAYSHFVAARRNLEESELRRAKQLQDQIFDDTVGLIRSGQLDTVRLSADSGVGADERLRELRDLAAIKRVVLENTDVTDCGLDHIGTFPQLETLALFCADVSDTGIECLRNNSTLRQLVLQQTKVRDKGLLVLQTLPNLRFLLFDREFAGTVAPGFGESVSVALKKLRQLEELEIGGNWVDEKIVSEIKSALPKVKVTRLKKGKSRRFQISLRETRQGGSG